MPWRGHDAVNCKICGGHRDEVGPLSARYKCASCAKKRQQENLDQLQAHEGPLYRAWRRAMIRESVEWLVATGEKTEEEGERLLEFHQRSASKRLPEIATARQRHVREELHQHYREAHGDRAQGVFLALMNNDLQRGMPRLQAEERALEYVRAKFDADFTPLRA